MSETSPETEFAAEALDPANAMAVVMSSVLTELEARHAGAVGDMIDRLAARLSEDVVVFRARPVPAAVVEAQRGALAWLRQEAPAIVERGEAKRKKRRKRAKGLRPRHEDRR